MLDTAFYITSAIALTLFFLSLIDYQDVYKNMLVPALGVGLNLLACLGAVQIEVPHFYIYEINGTVYTYSTTELRFDIALALLFMLLTVICCAKFFYNLYNLAKQLRIEKELKMEGWT